MNNNTYGEKNDHNLNFDEEILLSKKIKSGNAAKEKLLHNDHLSETEQKKLEALMEEGEIAYEQLVNANVPRAMKFAYETWRKNKYGVNDLEDYQQTALKVICACARTFDWEKGFRFGTYAHNCLRNEMLRENARTCYALRIPEENLLRLNAAKQKADTSFEKIEDLIGNDSEKLLAACRPQISLQAPLDKEDSDTEFGDVLTDIDAVTAEQIEEAIEMEIILMRLNKALEALSEDEQFILKGRMGFFGEPQPLKSFVGITAKSISGVQKKQLAAEKHLRELYFATPIVG